MAKTLEQVREYNRKRNSTEKSKKAREKYFLKNKDKIYEYNRKYNTEYQKRKEVKIKKHKQFKEKYHSDPVFREKFLTKQRKYQRAWLKRKKDLVGV